MNNRVRAIHTSKMHLSKKMETVGATLKKERIKLKKNLSGISLDTRIDIKKLKALEENNFSTFESPVSTKGFIKIYAEYLNLDAEKILAVYRRDFGERQSEKKKTEEKDEKKQIPWKYILLILPIVLIILILNYFFNQFSHFQNPPTLEILEPEDNITVNEESLNIVGKTEKDTIIEIMDSKVALDENNNFNTKVKLEEGQNILTIRATNSRNPSRETTEILNITYEPIEEEEEEEEEIEKIDEIQMTVTVENTPTWIEIVIDDQLIISQILQVGYSKDFVAERNISVNTGIIENTNVQVNGDRKILSRENFGIKCEILEEKLECQ